MPPFRSRCQYPFDRIGWTAQSSILDSCLQAAIAWLPSFSRAPGISGSREPFGEQFGRSGWIVVIAFEEVERRSSHSFWRADALLPSQDIRQERSVWLSLMLRAV
jgi:hypothetical protein